MEGVKSFNKISTPRAGSFTTLKLKRMTANCHIQTYKRLSVQTMTASCNSDIKKGCKCTPLILLKTFCQSRSSLEFNNLLGRDIQFCTGTGVAYNSCASLLNLKGAH